MPMDAALATAVKASAPTVIANSKALGDKTYTIMYRDHPQVIEIFDKSQYSDGAGIVPTKLAVKVGASLGEFATHCDDDAKLKSMYDDIAKVHVKYGVKKEHYPCFKDALEKAMKDVLGSGATPELVDTWKKAFDYLSGFIMELEATHK